MRVNRSRRRRGEAPLCSGSTLRYRAGRDGDSEHLGDGRIVKAVLHFADRPDHAMLVRACVGGGLERRLVRAQARFLIYFGARIPEQNLRGDVAGDWFAARVEHGDAFFPRCVEQVVGLPEHGGDGQPLTGLRGDLELVGIPRPDASGFAGSDRSVGEPHMDDARLAPLPRSGSPDVNSGARFV